MRLGWREMIFDYDIKDNSRATRHVRDLVRTTEDPDVLLGKFYYVNRHGDWRGGWFFTLTKIK